MTYEFQTEIFSGETIFEIRQPKILKLICTLLRRGKLNFWLQNRTRHTILRRLVCDDNSHFAYFSLRLLLNAYAIAKIIKNTSKMTIDLLSSHTSRREILCWIRIWSQNLISTYAKGRKIDFKILRGRNPKIFAPLKLLGHFVCVL